MKRYGQFPQLWSENLQSIIVKVIYGGNNLIGKINLLSIATLLGHLISTSTKILIKWVISFG